MPPLPLRTDAEQLSTDLARARQAVISHVLRHGCDWSVRACPLRRPLVELIVSLEELQAQQLAGQRNNVNRFTVIRGDAG